MGFLARAFRRSRSISVKRIAILLAAVCLALPALAGAQGYGHRGGGGGAQHAQGGPAPGRGGPGGYQRPGGGGAPYGGPRGGPAYGYPGARAGYPGPGPGYGGARVGGFRFSRGQILPPSYRGGVISDYGRYHLRRPPRGYYWYRAGDDFVLVAVATGMIFDVIGAEGY
jgi:Ni/Co efflux regulator RcnB